MKRLVLFVFFLSPLLAFAQRAYDDEPRGLLDKKRPAKSSGPEVKPFKGATKITALYDLSGEALYDKLSKELVGFGYSIDKRDKDLLLINTGEKPVKHHIVYTLRLAVNDSTVTISGMYKSVIGFQLSGIKTEQLNDELKYTSKAYVLRDAFDQVISFVESTHPIKIEYSK